ncbi:MAG: iron uptake system component EfeO [Acidimicrobiaceae bacterium]|nr:iron uptake system component EfeO [Acidimicrobiaceae bacterium]
MSRGPLVVAPLVIAALAASCSSSAKVSAATSSATSASVSASSGPKTIEVTLSDDGCAPRNIAATAGPTTFKVTNSATAAVTEFEVMDGSKILGEVENVVPGADRNFSLTLKAGSYTTSCPGGAKFDKGTLEVADAATGAAANQAARTAAVDSYLTYVKGEADRLIAAAGPFAAAVKSGDSITAELLFAGARAPYEAIEPIAESFGDLDPQIDAREGDVADHEFGGFHRIEKALWKDHDLASMGPVADKLLADVGKLRTEIDTIEIEPAQIANGAVELLNEVSTSKITGEEDRYSHTDLSDFDANLAGSKAAFEALRPLLDARQSDLANDVEQRFRQVQAALDKFKGNDPIGNGYVLYAALTPTDTRTLAGAVDTLAEPLSRVAAAVIGG